jgi:hypothetical protein
LESDITSCQFGTKFRADHEISSQVGESARQVQRYIRLTELLPELLDLVDKKRLQFTVAVEISYIDPEVQKWIYEYIRENGQIKLNQITALRTQMQMGVISQSKVISVLNNSLPGRLPSPKLTFTEKKLREYFPSGYSVTQMRSVIEDLLAEWKMNQEEKETNEFDEENRVYIVYPVTEAQEDLGIGKKKAMEVIAELVEFGLLEKKRRGQGLPSLLYVKSFMTGIDSNKKESAEQVYSDVQELAASSSAQTEVPEREHQGMDSKESEVSEGAPQGTDLTGSEISRSESQESGMNEAEISEMALQKPAEPVQQGLARLTDAAETALSAKESYEADYTVQHGFVGSEVSERALPEVPESTLLEVSKPALQEVPKSAPLMSKTDINNTYRSYISSHPGFRSLC